MRINKIIYASLWLSTSLLFLFACTPKVKRAFTPADLIVPIDYFPLHWEMAGKGKPSPMGSDLGFGDKDDRYVNYKLINDKFNLSSHYVMQFDSAEEATDWYREEFSYHFNDNSIAVDAPWRTPAAATFESVLADQFFLGCTINNVVRPKQVCQFIGQYEEFVILFWAIIRSDTMSVAEFEKIVEGIDTIMYEHLQLPVP